MLKTQNPNPETHIQRSECQIPPNTTTPVSGFGTWDLGFGI
jgi:hypothetical protein